MLVFVFQNATRQDARITISWNQDARNRVNYRMPCTDFTEVVVADRKNLPLKLAKLRLDQDWGEYLDF